MIRSVFSYLSALCVFASTSAFGQPTTISSSEIVLPVIGEFVPVTRVSQEVHPILIRMAQECDGRNCGMYTSAFGSAEVQSRTWDSFPPFILLEMLDDEMVVQAGQFPSLMQILKADAEGFRANVESGFAELPFDIDIIAPDGSDLLFISASAEAEQEFYESEICLAIPVLGTVNYKNTDGSIVGHGLMMMVGFVHVRDKIAVISLIAPGKEMSWTERTFEDFIEVLANKNR